MMEKKLVLKNDILSALHTAGAFGKYAGKHMTAESGAIMEDGKRVWKTYQTLYVDGEDFEQIGEAFEEEGKAVKTALGNGSIHFMRQRELADFAVDWIQKNRK